MTDERAQLYKLTEEVACLRQEVRSLTERFNALLEQKVELRIPIRYSAGIAAIFSLLVIIITYIGGI